jgi:hypothetical protein
MADKDEDGTMPVVVGPDGSQQSLTDWVGGTGKYIVAPTEQPESVAREQEPGQGGGVPVGVPESLRQRLDRDLAAAFKREFPNGLPRGAPGPMEPITREDVQAELARYGFTRGVDHSGDPAYEDGVGQTEAIIWLVAALVVVFVAGLLVGMCAG